MQGLLRHESHDSIKVDEKAFVVNLKNSCYSPLNITTSYIFHFLFSVKARFHYYQLHIMLSFTTVLLVSLLCR